jgi:hypothetical protein
MLGGIHGLRLRQVLGQLTRRASLWVALLALSTVLCPRTASAVDAVDLAVDAFVAGGAAIGVPISPTEANLVKPLVRCIADGKPVVDCTKEMVIAQLPRESQDLARCVSGGSNVAKCVENEAFKRLPPQSQELAKCVAGGSDVADCGKKFATTQAEKAAFGTIEKLKGDSKDKFKDATSPLQNIINTVDGIVREDWEKVIKNGGKAVAKYVIKTVITSLGTQVASILTGPIIDTIVDNRIDLVADLLNVARTGDVGKLAGVIAEFYLVMQVEIPCALIPAGAIKEAICGTLGKIIGAVGGAVGSVVGAVVDAIGDALDFLGGLAEDFVGLFDGKDDNCGTAQQYYANNFVTCYQRAAHMKGTNPAGYDAFEGSLYDSCRQHFIRCHKSDTVTRICGPLRDMFRVHAQTLDEALNQSAGAYARTSRSQLEANRSRVCSPHYNGGEVDRFVSGCESALKKRFPLPGDALSPNCRPDPKRCEGLFSCSTPTAQQAACRKAADGELKRITAEVCLGAGLCFKLDAPPKHDGPVVK